MKISVSENENDVVLIEVEGEVDALSARKLAKALSDVISQGQYRLVLDLSSVPFISSGGLRAIPVGGAQLPHHHDKGGVPYGDVGPHQVEELPLQHHLPRPAGQGHEEVHHLGPQAHRSVVALENEASRLHTPPADPEPGIAVRHGPIVAAAPDGLSANSQRTLKTRRPPRRTLE